MKLNRKLILALGSFPFVLYGLASPITPEQAMDRYRHSGARMSRSADASSMKLRHTAKMKDGTASAYVFAAPVTEKGFVILSADDRALPVLGYSESTSFDAANIPSGLSWWLEEYGRRIEFIQENGIDADVSNPYAPESWTAVEPLCKTTWNQGAPYDQMTPTVSNAQTPTGCVATSFAQAMKYFNYPEKGEGVISYRWNGKNMRLNLGLKEFQWDKMLDSYGAEGSYTDEQAEAVAYLMKACGYAVEMDYGTNASGAQSYKIVSALVDYFGYDPNVLYEDRNLYSTVEWMRMIYDNIKNIGPVIYNGTAIDGGHSFICDGYNGNGYFHINWGWGGMSDGYYLLDVLNPEAQGTGGASGGFNWSQDAVIGMQKPTGDPVRIDYSNLKQMGNTNASLSGGLINFSADCCQNAGWMAAGYKEVRCRVGAIVENLESGETTYAEGGLGSVGTDVRLSPSVYYPAQNVHMAVKIPDGLGDGLYKVTLATKDLDYDDAPWNPILVTYGYSNYCTLTVAGGKYQVANQSPRSLTYEDVHLDKTLYYGKNTMLSVRIANNTGLDITECIRPVLVSGGSQRFVGDYMLVSVLAGETIEKDWIIKFFDAPGSDAFVPDSEYTLQLVDMTSGLVIGDFGKVTMKVVSGSLEVKSQSFGVEDASQEDVTIGDRSFRNVYKVSDSANIPVKLVYDVTSGYFDSSLRIGIQYFDPQCMSYVIYDPEVYSDRPFLAKGDTGEVKLDLNLSNAPKEGVYNVRATYFYSGRERNLTSFYMSLASSGVNDVVVEDAAVGEYYNLMGVRITEPSKGDVVIRRCGDKVEKIIY